MDKVRQEVYNQFDKISIKLGEGPYFIGEQITYVDILFFEVLKLLEAFTDGGVYD